VESVEGWEGGVRKTDLLKPSADHNDLRANVVIKAGPAADVQSAGLSLACTTVFQRSGTVCPAM